MLQSSILAITPQRLLVGVCVCVYECIYRTIYVCINIGVCMCACIYVGACMCQANVVKKNKEHMSLFFLVYKQRNITPEGIGVKIVWKFPGFERYQLCRESFSRIAWFIFIVWFGLIGISPKSTVTRSGNTY